MTTTTETHTFQTGATYVANWATDHTLRTLLTVVKRTPKFITLEDSDGKTMRVGVKVDEQGEWALPFGTFSMAPVVRADREVA